MKAPIIIDNSGDLLIFSSIEQAQQYLEPIDVHNKEYIAYDSEGRLLKLNVTREKSDLRRLPTFADSGEHITLQPAESEPLHAAELQSKLIQYFAQVGEARKWLRNATLAELVQKGVEKYVTG